MNHKHASLLTSIYDCVASVQIICYVVLTGAASHPQNISWANRCGQDFLVELRETWRVSKCKNAKQLVAIDLSGDNILSTNLIFLGQKAKSIVKENDKEYLEKVVNVHISCGKYILKKLPLRKRNLKTISSFDPKLVTSSTIRVLDNLLGLQTFLSMFWGAK